MQFLSHSPNKSSLLAICDNYSFFIYICLFVFICLLVFVIIFLLLSRSCRRYFMYVRRKSSDSIIMTQSSLYPLLFVYCSVCDYFSSTTNAYISSSLLVASYLSSYIRYKFIASNLFTVRPLVRFVTTFVMLLECACI